MAVWSAQHLQLVVAIGNWEMQSSVSFLPGLDTDVLNMGMSSIVIHWIMIRTISDSNTEANGIQKQCNPKITLKYY